MITPYRPERDGVGDCSVSLVPEMRRARRGLDFVIVSHDIGKARPERGIHRIVYRKSVTRSILPQMVEELRSLPRTFEDVRRTMEIIEKEKVGLVHIQYEPGVFNLLYAPMLLRRLRKKGVKSVLTLHGRDYSLLGPIHRALLYPYADAITVHTDLHKRLIGRENVFVVPMGINRLPRPRKNKLYDSVLFFGFMSPYKGVEYLVRAFARALGAVPDARLIINGPVNETHPVEVKYRDEIAALIDELGIKDVTDFEPRYTERGKLPDIASNIVVFPYAGHYSAGQSAAILDSIAAGKAVIATKIPGIFERIRDGVNGLVVEPENVVALSDAIVRLLGDKRLLARICRNNLRMAREESWARSAKMTLAVYDRVLRK